MWRVGSGLRHARRSLAAQHYRRRQGLRGVQPLSQVEVWQRPQRPKARIWGLTACHRRPAGISSCRAWLHGGHCAPDAPLYPHLVDEDMRRAFVKRRCVASIGKLQVPSPPRTQDPSQSTVRSLHGLMRAVGQHLALEMTVRRASYLYIRAMRSRSFPCSLAIVQAPEQRKRARLEWPAALATAHRVTGRV